MRTIFLVILAAAMMSCKTNQLYLNVLQPAPVTLPQDVRKVGVINRSIPTDETKAIDALDRILSLEGADLDRVGAWESISGLTAELRNNDRFNEVRELEEIDFRASRIGILPVPLNGRIVDSLCRLTGMDALFALERFDTDTRVDFSTPSGKIEVALGTFPVIGLQASMETIVKTGWRIYSPGGILDEFSFAESLIFAGKGINPVAAISAIKGRKDAVREVSRNAGYTYASRILPWMLRVERDYFVKGTDNFKIAKRKAQTGKWDEAGNLWEREVSNPDAKIAGRASYNMAIISEINGSVDEALGWAQKAWEDYGIRPALKYVRILENRKRNIEILEIQEIKE